MRTSLPGLVLLLAAAAAVTARAEPPREIRLWPDGVPGERVPADPAETVERGADEIQRRGNVSDPRLLVQPLPVPSEGKRAAVIILPGGGYRILADEHEGTEIGRFLGGHGIVAFTLLYRVPTAAFADDDAGPVMDAKRAVALVRERADDYGVDPTRVAIMGFSAGGHTALVAATSAPEHADTPAAASRPDLAILVYPWRVLAESGEGLWPGVVIDRETPPMFIAQTADDTASPVRGALALYAGLVEAKVPAELHVYERGGHGYGLRRREKSPGTADWPHRLVDWLSTRGYTRP